jgi:hypothetical protein
MTRTAYVFKTPQGFLSDINHYTNDPSHAVSFVDFDSAAARLAAASGSINEPVSIQEVQLPFPAPFPTNIK